MSQACATLDSTAWSVMPWQCMMAAGYTLTTPHQLTTSGNGVDSSKRAIIPTLWSRFAICPDQIGQCFQVVLMDSFAVISGQTCPWWIVVSPLFNTMYLTFYPQYLWPHLITMPLMLYAEDHINQVSSCDESDDDHDDSQPSHDSSNFNSSQGNFCEHDESPDSDDDDVEVNQHQDNMPTPPKPSAGLMHVSRVNCHPRQSSWTLQLNQLDNLSQTLELLPTWHCISLILVYVVKELT